MVCVLSLLLKCFADLFTIQNTSLIVKAEMILFTRSSKLQSTGAGSKIPRILFNKRPVKHGYIIPSRQQTQCLHSFSLLFWYFGFDKTAGRL